MTPQVTEKNLKNLGILQSYDLKRPVARPVSQVLQGPQDVLQVLSDSQKFKTFDNGVFAQTASNVSVLANMYVSSCATGTCADLASSSVQRKLTLTQALFPSQDAFGQHKAWFGATIRQLIKDNSYKPGGVAGSRLDIVGNVINLTPVYWVSQFLVRLSAQVELYAGKLMAELDVARDPVEDAAEPEGHLDSSGGQRHAAARLRVRNTFDLLDVSAF